MGRKIEVENTINSKVIFKVPELHFKRVWMGRGTRRTIDLDILKEGFYDPGNEYLFTHRILIIKDKDARIELGLQEPDNEADEKEEPIFELTDKQIKRYLTVAPTMELKELMPKLSREQQLTLVDFAIQNELTAIDKCDVLKQFTGKDVLKILQLKREAEEK